MSEVVYPPEQQPMITDVALPTLRQQLFKHAHSLLGRKYDTRYDPEKDRAYNGQALRTPSGKRVVSYRNHPVPELIDQEPIVCIDLVIRALQSIGFRPEDTLQWWSLRRTRDVETRAQSQTNLFVVPYGSRAFSVGDFLSLETADPQDTSRHIGLISALDESGRPLKVIHATSKLNGTFETDIETFTQGTYYRYRYHMGLKTSS